MVRTALLLVLVLAGTAHAQVYKCKGANGQLVYSQAPCPGDGTLLDSRKPPAETRGPLTQRREVERAMRSPEAAPQPAPAVIPGRKHCLDQQEVKNLETSASSIHHDRFDKQVWAEQLRRAHACERLLTDIELQAMKLRLQDQARATRALDRASRKDERFSGPDKLQCFGNHCTGGFGSSYRPDGAGHVIRDDGTRCSVTSGWANC